MKAVPLILAFLFLALPAWAYLISPFFGTAPIVTPCRVKMLVNTA